MTAPSLSSHVVSWKQKSDDFIAGQWNSGQMVPASVAATTRAGNVTQVTLHSWNWWECDPRVRTHTCTYIELKYTQVLCDVSTIMQEENLILLR